MPILDAEPTRYPTDVLALARDAIGDRVWWAVYTKARQEKALARSLFGANVPFYLPLIPKDNAIRGRKIRSHIPLFSGYVFLYGTGEEREKTLATNRVSRIMPVPDQQQLVYDLTNVDQLIAANVPLTLESRISAGDWVRVKTGPFRGTEGIVVRRRTNARLLVAVQFLQQGVSVEIEDFQLESLHR